MNFRILKEIVIMVKEKIRCLKCKKSVSNKEINIEAIRADKVLLRCSCNKCGSHTLVDVILAGDKAAIQNTQKFERKHKGLKISAKPMQKVSHDDILDIKNFLKEFKGDFKTMFGNK